MQKNNREGKPLPFDEETDRYLFDDDFSVASTTECTGLMPTPADTNDEVASYSDIYDSPLSRDASEEKPKNNKGKRT